MLMRAIPENQMINKMRHFILMFVAIAWIFGCSQKTELVETVDEFGNTVKYSRNKKDYAKEGKYLIINPDGITVEEAYYVNDSLDGARIVFFDSGDTSIIEHHKMGKFEGTYKAFYENGQIEIEGNYVNNIMSGPWTRYYESGQVMEVVNFENNEENGAFVEYYKNGNLKAEGAYLNGDNEHGELKIYNEAGKLIRRMDCQKGICKTI